MHPALLRTETETKETTRRFTNSSNCDVKMR